MQILQERKPGIMNRAQNLFMDRLSIFGVAFLIDMLLGRALARARRSRRRRGWLILIIDTTPQNPNTLLLMESFFCQFKGKMPILRCL
jgi:hypothetical protein